MATERTGARLHRRMAVETPEHVRLDYAVADLGSRAAALAIDVVVLSVGLGVLGLALVYARMLDEIAESISGTILIFAVFFVQWGYFALFEGVGGGRTLGKRALGIRVIHAGGEPVTFRGSMLRNLIRVVDFLPAAGLAGAICILANRRAQRLGDMVADTVVVIDAGGIGALGAEAPPPARTGRPVLSPAQFELLAGYMARRDGLSGKVRERVAASVVGALAFAMENDPKAAGRDADENLARLHEEEAPRHAARRGGASLQAAAMAREQRDEWARYVKLVENGRKRGLRGMEEDEVRAFGRLYRGIVADLARARTYGASPGLAGTVQRWAGAGHNLLYRARGRAAISLWHWVAKGFPRAVRRHRGLILLAVLVKFGPMLATYAAVREDPLLGRALVGPETLIHLESMEKGNIEAFYQGDEFEGSDMPVFGAKVMTNNIGVIFYTFAGGFLAGLGTLYILVLNGVVLGAVFGAWANEGGVLGVILAFVFSHGFIELTSHCIAGGAGFGLASALLVPGRRTRTEALAERGRVFLSLVAGAVLMDVVAGVIEGFYSPSALPAAAKFAFGSATAVLLVLYFGFAGRRPDATAAPAP